MPCLKSITSLCQKDKCKLLILIKSRPYIIWNVYLSGLFSLCSFSFLSWPTMPVPFCSYDIQSHTSTHAVSSSKNVLSLFYWEMPLHLSRFISGISSWLIFSWPCSLLPKWDWVNGSFLSISYICSTVVYHRT